MNNLTYINTHQNLYHFKNHFEKLIIVPHTQQSAFNLIYKDLKLANSTSTKETQTS
jgi:hypothetical protein